MDDSALRRIIETLPDDRLDGIAHLSPRHQALVDHVRANRAASLAQRIAYAGGAPDRLEVRWKALGRDVKARGIAQAEAAEAERRRMEALEERHKVRLTAKAVEMERAAVVCEHGYRRPFCLTEGCPHWGGREAGSGEGPHSHRW